MSTMAPPPSSAMPPPSTAVVWRSVGLTLRVLTVISLVVSLIIITTNTATLSTSNFGRIKIRFQDVKAYRYVLATIVIGLAYGFLQIAFTIYHVTTGNRIGGDALYFFDFYGDKFISYLLATGTGAGFGVTVDLKDANSGADSGIDKFFNKGNAASSILLLAFIFTAISSILSSLSLPKKA